MVRNTLIMIIFAVALSACGFLSPVSDATQDALYGAADEPKIDHRTAARAAAGQALIQKGIDTPDPAVAERWINMGVSLMD